jgi:hypothetical protein
LEKFIHWQNQLSIIQGTLQEYPLAIRLKIVTGNYILQSDKAAFSKKSTSPICLLCKKPEETTTHFLIVCEKLEETRTPILSKIIQEVSSIFADLKLCGKIDLFTNNY